jgi:ribosome-interacting GTPase 1
MPTNVSVEYAVAEQDYNKASTTEEKITALQKMLSTAPSHKGAENLRQDIKSKLAKFKDKLEAEKEKKRGTSFAIKKEGAATILFIGPPNSGKSLLLNRLTGTKVAVADYGFTTTRPEIGIMDYKGLKFQVIELPAITPDFYKTEKGPAILSIVRNGDLIIIVTDTDDINYILYECEKAGILLNEPFKVDVDESYKHMQGLIIFTKKDVLNSEKKYMGLKKFYNFDTIPISLTTENNMEKLKDEIWKNLNLIKIYTKEPGKKPNMDKPLCLNKGSSIRDMAGQIHKDFIKKFRFARVWGSSARFQGQQSGLDHLLNDEDTVEIHLS